MTVLSTAVRDHRRAALFGIMDAHGLDALLLSGADWFEFATNHAIAVQGWERPYAMALTRDGRSAALLHDLSAAKIGIARERGRLWLDETTFYSEVPQVAGSRPLLTQWTQTFAGILSSFGLARGKAGVDASPGFIAGLSQPLPNLEFVPLGAALRLARWVKHADEIAVMREAARISDWSIARYREEIRPGRLLQELDHAIAAQTCAEAARRFPGEDFQVLRFMTLSGASAAAAHGDGCTTGAVVLAGTVLVATCNLRLNGLSMENQCTFAIGKVEYRMRELMKVALAANRAGLAAAVVGQRVSG
ncbi:MAG: M24 family metallopeptidase, partial [Burkholderiales bacterium]